MSTNQNLPPSVLGVRRRESSLQLEPRKKPRAPNPLVHHGRHFGRTVHALCSVKQLLRNCIPRLDDIDGVDEEEDRVISIEDQREYRVFQSLLRMIPGLEDRLLNSSDEEIDSIACSIQKGVSNAKSDDTKSLKSAVLDWIMPPGQELNPPLARNVKSDRGFHHERTGALLCPTGLDWSDLETRENLRTGELTVPGDQWPIFIYQDFYYDADNPWRGAFRSSLLISAFKYIFTSPSSVNKEPNATRSGNARIHGMIQVTGSSIAYVATQVKFALTSSPVFSKSEKVTDSERFYNTILDLFDDPEEVQEVDELLSWWNRQIFPRSSFAQPVSCKDSAFARIKEKRAAAKALQDNINK